MENGCQCFGWEASVRRARRAPARRDSGRAGGKRLVWSARAGWAAGGGGGSGGGGGAGRASGEGGGGAPIVAVLAAAGRRQTPWGLTRALGPRRAAAVLPA